MEPHSNEAVPVGSTSSMQGSPVSHQSQRCHHSLGRPCSLPRVAAALPPTLPLLLSLLASLSGRPFTEGERRQGTPFACAASTCARRRRRRRRRSVQH